jgi:glycosyltransferase involved in cell wall biosynthesis
MKKPSRIFCLMDYHAFTGFATVSQNIKKEIKKHFGSDIKLDICAINYFGDPYEEEDGTYVISAVKNAPKKDDFGRYGFLKILKESNEYDGIFIVQDLGVIIPIIKLLKYIKDEKKNANQKQFKSIFYFPVDNKLFDKLVEGLEFFDTLVAYTEFGRNEVLRLRPELKGKVKVVPHGNNSKHFYPIEDREEVAKFRNEYFGKNADKFIITNVNRNQSRKDIPTTIFSFIEAKRRWKDMNLPKELFLYLHMNAKDPMGWDLRAIMVQTDLVENRDFMLLENDLANKGASIEMLNKIYNASDLFVTTTLGEGWGLTLTEAMATKTPVICPLSTSFIEMTNNGQWAYVVENQIPVSNLQDNLIRNMCDYEEVADTILYVAEGMLGKSEKINFTETHNKKLEKAYEYTKSLDWSNVCKAWVEYFKSTY